MINKLKLADIHIQKFEKMIGSGNSFVNVPECIYYLNLWRSIKKKVESNLALNQSEENEILEAVESGEYDDLLDSD